jgi:hypothetical protein
MPVPVAEEGGIISANKREHWISIHGPQSTRSQETPHTDRRVRALGLQEKKIAVAKDPSHESHAGETSVPCATNKMCFLGRSDVTDTLVLRLVVGSDGALAP